MPNRLDSILMLAAGAVFVVATGAMLGALEPFATWYYSFAWWCYIVLADAWIHRRTRTSVLLRTAEAPQMMALSVVIWVFFETYNFRLGNWYYLEIPSNQIIRWVGYSIAYATVLPGIFVTAELLHTMFPARATARVELPLQLPAYLLWGGIVGSILPWVWPVYFFPLVWLGPTALFLAINDRWGREGLLNEIRERGFGKFYRLAAAGMLCGLLWECWNYWARSKWIYEIPFLGEHPLFEMPLAGFLGFPPFAIACHEMYVAARGLLRRLQPYPVARILFWFVLGIVVSFVYQGIDAFTVRSFQP